MASKVCDTRDLDRPYYRKLAEDYMQLANDGTDGWRDNNHVFRAWEYAYSYSELKLGKAKRLCDIGSENSIWPIWLKKRHPELQVVCVDPHTNGRLEARAQLHGTALDIQSREFGSGMGKFDRIACISVMEHVASDEDVALIVEPRNRVGRAFIEHAVVISAMTPTWRLLTRCCRKPVNSPSALMT